MRPTRRAPSRSGHKLTRHSPVCIVRSRDASRVPGTPAGSAPRLTPSMKQPLATALTAALLIGLAGAAPAAPGDSLAQVQATELNLIRALMEQGVLSADKAREMLRKAGIDPALLKPQVATAAAAPAAAAPAATT